MSADNYTDCPKCEGRLREDWDIGIYGDRFEVDYRGACTECDFKYTFQENIELYITNPKRFK